MENIEIKLKMLIQKALKNMGVELALERIVIERSKEKEHGDYATNVAMQMAKELHKAPRDIALSLKDNLQEESIEKVEIAGPGFINFFMRNESLTKVLKRIFDEKENYGSSNYGQNQRINVEYVSANPTGDLHLGHARGAAIGDSICRLYKKIGYDVTREFYVNDAGNQIENLAKSLFVRYHEAFNDFSIPFPDDGYHADDIKMIAKTIKQEIGDSMLKAPYEDFKHFLKKRGTELELEKLREDLRMFRVEFDVFSSELRIRNEGRIEKVLSQLQPYIYEQDNAKFLKTTDFSDDKDRVIVKSDGSYTYLLPDIAYHQDKLERGFTKLIDCLGADHHGYIERMKSSLAMIGYDPDILDIELIQMVRLFKDGKEYKMSKRTGNAVSMKELCEEVGVDSVRYFFVARAASSHLDFDLDLAKKTEASNPVYYAQYGHARLCALLDQGKDLPLDEDGKELKEEKELNLLKVLNDFPREVLQAALTRAPYKISIYIQKLATAIHEFYTECRVLNRSNIKLTSSRLALTKASEIVMKNALDLIGVTAPERM